MTRKTNKGTGTAKQTRNKGTGTQKNCLTFAAGVRQGASLRTLGQLNFAGAVAASFALPFILTAQVVCNTRCSK